MSAVNDVPANARGEHGDGSFEPWFVVILAGEVDMARAPELAEIVSDFRNSQHTHARVDLSAVTFLDSTGLGALSALRNVCLPRGGSVVLVAAQPAVIKVLQIVGFDAVFTLEQEEAPHGAASRDASTPTP